MKAIYIFPVILAAACSTPREKADATHPGESHPIEASVMLSDSQVRLANITTQRVSVKSISESIPVNGKVVSSDNSKKNMSSRVSGRIEKLFIKETGRIVNQGEPLYEIYSEELLVLQNEYLLAKTQAESLGAKEPRYLEILKAAKQKLLLYGLSESQIADLHQSAKAYSRITFLAPSAGVVTEITGNEGMYVSEGTLLYRIENISELWVEADLYPGESSFVELGNEFLVLVAGDEDKPVSCKVIFKKPELDPVSQIMTVRLALNNSKLTYKPGMHAQILINKSSRPAFSLPRDAVIRTSKGAHVYVQTDKNTFKPRAVGTGSEDFENVEIVNGLNKDEVVAVSGAYLIYSEFVLKNGIDPSLYLTQSMNRK